LSSQEYSNIALRTVNDSLEVIEDTVGLTEEELLASMHNDFIKDDVRKSILNEYYEVSIGDYVYVFFSEDQIYKIDMEAEDEIQDFRDTPKGGDEIQFDLVTENVELISDEYAYQKNSTVEVITDERMTLAIKVTTPDPCGNPYLKNIELLQAKVNGQPIAQVTSFNINWGDGTTQAFPNFPSGTLTNITHTYPSSSPGGPLPLQQHFYITASATTLSNTQPISLSATTGVHITTYECNVSVGSHDEVIKGNVRGMKITLWYTHDIFGMHAGAKTAGLKKKNNGNWVDKWGQMSSKIYYHLEPPQTARVLNLALNQIIVIFANM
jgi:hypothetical protein